MWKCPNCGSQAIRIVGFAHVCDGCGALASKLVEPANPDDLTLAELREAAVCAARRLGSDAFEDLSDEEKAKLADDLLKEVPDVLSEGIGEYHSNHWCE